MYRGCCKSILDWLGGTWVATGCPRTVLMSLTTDDRLMRVFMPHPVPLREIYPTLKETSTPFNIRLDFLQQFNSWVLILGRRWFSRQLVEGKWPSAIFLFSPDLYLRIKCFLIQFHKPIPRCSKSPCHQINCKQRLRRTNYRDFRNKSFG